METDIETKIKNDFGSNALIAINMVQRMENELKTDPRISRCVVHLAHGDIFALRKVIDNARKDWNDVITSAQTTPFQFTKPFKF